LRSSKRGAAGNGGPAEVYDPIARFYDLDHAGFEDDLEFYRQFARASPGPILDIGVGTGRVAAPLARDGRHIVGVDISRQMLARAKRRLSQEGVAERVTLVEADAASFVSSQRCGLALFTLNTFSHMLRLPEQMAALTNVRRHLLPGGRLLIDQWNPHASSAPDSSGQWVFGYRRQDVDGRWVMQSVSSVAEPSEQILQTTVVYDEELPFRTERRRARRAKGNVGRPTATPRRTVVSLQLRYFYRFEVEWLLLASGYELEVVFGTYDLDLYTTGAPRLIWLARNSVQSE